VAKIIIELDGDEAAEVLERFQEMEAFFSRVKWLEEQVEQLTGELED